MSASFSIVTAIFFLAAKIISSLLFCRRDCLSSLLKLQPFFPDASSPPSVACTSSFSFKLYLVIKSGCEGGASFGCGVEVRVVDCAFGSSG